MAPTPRCARPPWGASSRHVCPPTRPRPANPRRDRGPGRPVARALDRPGRRTSSRRLRGLSHVRGGRRRRQGGRRCAPDIAKRFSIGKSYQGREIWAMKISDNVATDEPSRRSCTRAATMPTSTWASRWRSRSCAGSSTATGRTRGSRTSSNSREIWIVFLVNPDGAEYDIATDGSTAGARTASRRPARRISARTSTATTATAGAAADARARTRRPSPTAARRRSRRPRPGPCATSSPAASSTAGSRSGPPSRSTRPAGS